jgi:hypothetical protein
MIGRCLRPQPGKRAVVLDHVGNTIRMGHHLEPRDWTLDGIKKRDRDAAPSVKVCPQCFAAMASQAKQCGECGHTFAPEARELQQVEGELVEIGAIKVGDYVRFKDPKEMMESPDTFEVVNVSWNYAWITKKNYPTVKCLIDRIMIDPRGAKRQQGTAQSLDDLRQLAQQRGYKRGWAERVYQARLAKRYGI